MTHIANTSSSNFPYFDASVTMDKTIPSNFALKSAKILQSLQAGL